MSVASKTRRYPLNGGMQDFNYIFTNDMEITLELSCCKFPKRYYLNREWERNHESLLSYVEQEPLQTSRCFNEMWQCRFTVECEVW